MVPPSSIFNVAAAELVKDVPAMTPGEVPGLRTPLLKSVPETVPAPVSEPVSTRTMESARKLDFKLALPAVCTKDDPNRTLPAWRLIVPAFVKNVLAK